MRAFLLIMLLLTIPLATASSYGFLAEGDAEKIAIPRAYVLIDVINETAYNQHIFFQAISIAEPQNATFIFPTQDRPIDVNLSTTKLYNLFSDLNIKSIGRQLDEPLDEPRAHTISSPSTLRTYMILSSGFIPLGIIMYYHNPVEKNLDVVRGRYYTYYGDPITTSGYEPSSALETTTDLDTPATVVHVLIPTAVPRKGDSRLVGNCSSTIEDLIVVQRSECDRILIRTIHAMSLDASGVLLTMSFRNTSNITLQNVQDIVGWETVRLRAPLSLTIDSEAIEDSDLQAEKLWYSLQTTNATITVQKASMLTTAGRHLIDKLQKTLQKIFKNPILIIFLIILLILSIMVLPSIIARFFGEHLRGKDIIISALTLFFVGFLISGIIMFVRKKRIVAYATWVLWIIGFFVTLWLI